MHPPSWPRSLLTCLLARVRARPSQGTSGLGTFHRNLHYGWSRDHSCFGYILQANGAVDTGELFAEVNLDQGKMKINESEWLFRVTEDEWWKVNFKPDGILIDFDKDHDFYYSYRMLKGGERHLVPLVAPPSPEYLCPTPFSVIDRYGNPTEHFKLLAEEATSPLPFENCGTSWCRCWGCFLTASQGYQNMAISNQYQTIVFRPERRAPVDVLEERKTHGPQELTMQRMM